MKMNQRKVVLAYKALLRLSEQPLPLPVAYGLYKAKKALESAWQFQLEQEEKMIARRRADGIRAQGHGAQRNGNGNRSSRRDPSRGFGAELDRE